MCDSFQDSFGSLFEIDNRLLSPSAIDLAFYACECIMCTDGKFNVVFHSVESILFWNSSKVIVRPALKSSCPAAIPSKT
jgi:hypothetical protein